MLQSYKFILWRKHERQDITFDEIAERAYKAISVYQKLPEKYRPRMQEGNSKDNRKLVELTYDKFYEKLKSRVNQADGVIYKDLGYSIYCYSSLNSKESWGYDFSVGMTNDLFSNSFIVKLALDMDYFTLENSKLIEELFRETVQIFEPYFGAAVNSFLRDSVYFDTDTNELKSLHWLTYVSPELSTNLKEDKLKKLMKKYKEFEYDNGFIKLQNKAINAENPKEVKYVKKLEKELL